MTYGQFKRMIFYKNIVYQRKIFHLIKVILVHPFNRALYNGFAKGSNSQREREIRKREIETIEFF